MYELQEETGELTSTVEEPEKKSESQGMATGSAVSVAACGEKAEGERMKEKGVADPSVGDEAGKKVEGGKSEEKAAKIQRLKSGFRLCKPQGTFLWPSSMAMSPQVVVQVEDFLALPTPPSVSSSTSPPLPLPLPPPPPPLQPISPVKPLAEKRHVNLTPHHTTTLINLNEPPSVTASGSRGTFASASSPYQPNHTSTITDVLPRGKNGKDVVHPWEALAGPESKNFIGYSHQWQQRRGYSNSSISTSTPTPTSNTCLGMGLGTWLALSSPNSIDNSHRN